MNNNAGKQRNILLKSIAELSENHREFLVNPGTDYTRNRKLPLDTMIMMILCFEGGALKDEMYRLFGLSADIPTSSAFVRKRNRIDCSAFSWLLSSYNSSSYSSRGCLYHDSCRLPAVDGSCVPVRYDPSDSRTYVPGEDYNACHINAGYDLPEHTYDDVIIQGQQEVNECEAFSTSADRYSGPKAIYIADRLYATFNCMVHAEKSGSFYPIRTKDIFSGTGPLRSFGPSEDGESDIDAGRLFTRRNTNEIRSHPEIYRFMPANQKFDYFDEDRDIPYEFTTGIVRFRITDSTYECIMTNPDRNEFPAEEIRKLYNMRWGIETSFRDLKYAPGMNAFHSRRNNSILQEIYARIIFYNFCERITGKVKPMETGRKRKLRYQISATRAFHSIRTFLRMKKGGRKPPDIELIIAREIEPVREGRQESRKIRSHHAVYFTYRYD